LKPAAAAAAISDSSPTILIKYFKSSWSRTRTWSDLGTQIRPDPQQDPDLGKLVLGSIKNMPDETNVVNNAASCYKEAVQFKCFLCYDTICQVLTKFVEWQRILSFYRPSNTN